MIHKATLADGFTQSEISVLDECTFKWNMRYNERLELEGYYRLPLLFGSAWHKIMEGLYSKRKLQPIPVLEFPEGAIVTEGDEDKLKQAQFMLDGMAKAYSKHYADEVKTIKIRYLEEEVELDYEFNGFYFKLKAIIDMMDMSGTIYDSKSTSLLRNDILAKWNFKFQFMFYAWIVSIILGRKHAKKFAVNAVKKPQIRPKEKEPLVAYGRRVEMEMLSNPSNYFYRNSVDLTDELLENFETNILNPKLERFRLMQEIPKSPLWENKNTEACHHFGETCPYFPICAEGAGTKGYITLPTKHTNYDQI